MARAVADRDVAGGRSRGGEAYAATAVDGRRNLRDGLILSSTPPCRVGVRATQMSGLAREWNQTMQESDDARQPSASRSRNHRLVILPAVEGLHTVEVEPKALAEWLLLP